MENIFCRKYSLNPETLRFEASKTPKRKKLIINALTVILLVATAVGMRLTYDQYAKSPRLVLYEKENTELRNEYQRLANELILNEKVLAELKRKDDRMYRSIFGLEPIPLSIREAGTGGAVMHASLKSVSNPEMVIDVFDKLNKVLNKAKIQYNSFDDLQHAAIEQQLLLASKPSIQPISPADRFWLTSGFGYRKDPFTKTRRSHRGIDFAGRFGLKIYATGDGVVKIAEYSYYGYGKEVLINHGFGYSSRYAHLKEIFVKPGQKVKRGQVIGTMGNSGRSTGPHLHYEVLFNKKPLNPVLFYYEELSADEFNLISQKASAE